MWLIYLLVNVQQAKFVNVFRGQNSISKVRVSSSDIRNQVANCCLKIRGLKLKKHGTYNVLYDKKTTKKLQIRCLES